MTSPVVANYKLVILGESAVGKSSLALRLVKSQFSEFQEATIGDPPRNVKFEIWDTAGQERYHSLAPMYYRGAQVAVVVYDITNANSFQRAKIWVKELSDYSNPVMEIALVGNKVDLDEQRAVPIDETLRDLKGSKEAKTYSDENGLFFIETSAKLATNVVELFTALALRLPLEGDVTMLKGNQRLTEANVNTQHRNCCR